jgi:predicted dehydrogenase
MEAKSSSDEMTRRLRVGIVGGGEQSAIGRAHRLGQRVSERLDLVAGAFDIDADRGRRYAIAHGVPADRAYANVQELIDRERQRRDPVDMVCVLTPNNTHFEIARSLLQAGFHVLCEKPMTTRVPDAEELVRLTKERNAVFGVMYGYSGYPMIAHARELVRSGEIGSVRTIQSEFAFGLPVNLSEDPQGHWRTKKGIAGESAVVGMLATHVLYLITLITGLHARQVAADFQSYVPGRLLEDNANLMLRFDAGATGLMWNSYVAAGFDNGPRLRIYGDAGGIEWDHDYPNQLRLYKPGRPRQTFTQAGRNSNALAPEGFIECFAAVYRQIADAIEAKYDKPDTVSPYPSVLDGLEGVRFVAAAIESNGNNSAWIDVAR